MRYVPGRRLVHVNAVVAPCATSVENDCTRAACAGGVNTTGGGVPAPATPLAGVTVDHVVAVCVGCTGLGVVLAVVPRPPPTWPTMVSEVGTVPGRLLVRLIVRGPGGTVITTGDQPAPALGFAAAQLAGAVTAPHA